MYNLGTVGSEYLDFLCARAGGFTSSELSTALVGFRARQEMKDLKPFIVSNFFEGTDWTLQEEVSPMLQEVNLSEVRAITTLRDDEVSLDTAEALKRLTELGYTCLGARIFQAFLEKPELIPSSWKPHKEGEKKYILFPGGKMRGPQGILYILYLYWDGDAWAWHYTATRGLLLKNDLFATLLP